MLSGLGMAPVAWAQTNWTLAPGYAANVFMTQNLAQFAADLTKASQGKLSVKVGELGKPFAMTDIRTAVGEGKVEGGNVLGSALSKEFPTSGADSIPFMTSSYADAKRLWKHQRVLLEKEMAEKGLKLLYAVPWPAQGLYSTKPVNGIEDMRGIKMRTYNPTTVRVAELMGAQAVELANGPPLVKALAEGTIDSMITSSATGVDMKVWQRFKHFYDVRAWYPKNLTFVSAKAFNALDEATRKAVVNAAQAAEASGWALSEKVSGDALAELQRNQIQVSPTPGELAPHLKRFGERFAREWISTVGIQANGIFIPYYTGQ
ncbi:TRAP transporter substrate-binding protein [Ottowia testudinis]|uniref:TRAP transporter substrate-binding protein n=2 Tax=Ottowia testudinis TaxID=2816950 RepID=A0A975CIS0_9BURK|nr:TRAP transporter substrate-binding protein [Ottowia testudinis]